MSAPRNTDRALFAAAAITGALMAITVGVSTLVAYNASASHPVLRACILSTIAAIAAINTVAAAWVIAMYGTYDPATWTPTDAAALQADIASESRTTYDN